MPKKTKSLPKLWQDPKYKTWYLRGTGENGLTIKTRLDTKDEAEADRKRSEILFKMDKAKAGDVAGHKTLHWCIDFYMKHCAPLRRSKKAIARRMTFLKTNTAPALLVKELTRDLIADLKAKRIADSLRPGARPIIEATWRNDLIQMMAMLNYAADAEDGLNRGDVPKFISRKKGSDFLPKASPPRSNWMTHENIEHLLEVFRAANPTPHDWDGPEDFWKGKLPRIFIMGEIFYGTGRRVEATSELEWKRISLDQTQPIIDFRVNGVENNDKKLRGVAVIDKRLADILRQAYRERDKRTDFVFGPPTKGGPTKWTRKFQRLAIKAGFTKLNKKGEIVASIGPHTQRHSFISLALQGNHSTAKVSKAVACSEGTIRKVYGHLAAENLAEVAATASAGSGGKKPKLRRVK